MSSETQVEDAIKNYKSAPFDARFPNQNQTKNCWQNFVDFYRCKQAKGEDYAPCDWFKKVYTSVCPADWTEEWSDKMSSGAFPVRY